MAHEGPAAGLIVLVVEDETLVRLVAEEVLRQGGFATLSAANADRALTILESRNDIRAVFCDIAMPGSLDGAELVIVVRDRWPPIGIVLTSGHGGALPPGLADRARYLPKPYRNADLLEAIRSVI
jgi:CheY-like chemotaxis protein